MNRARHLCLWVFTLGALVVVVGVLAQAFTIAAYVRGAGQQARDLHVLGAYVVHTVEIVVFAAALGAFRFSWPRAALALLFPVVGTVQVFAIGDTSAPGGWVNGLHGTLALVVLLWAAGFAWLGVRALSPGPSIRLRRRRPDRRSPPLRGPAAAAVDDAVILGARPPRGRRRRAR